MMIDYHVKIVKNEYLSTKHVKHVNHEYMWSMWSIWSELENCRRHGRYAWWTNTVGVRNQIVTNLRIIFEKHKFIVDEAQKLTYWGDLPYFVRQPFLVRQPRLVKLIH